MPHSGTASRTLVARTLVLALLVRLPEGAIGLLIVLAVRDAGHSYAVAGACSGAAAVGLAIATPLIGRAIDRLGQSIILSLASVAVLLTTGAFVLLPESAPALAYVALSLLVGGALPPVASCVRVIWHRRLEETAFERALTWDASLQELSFTGGAVVFATIAAAGGPPEAMLISAGLLAVSTWLFALLPETRHAGSASETAVGLGPLRLPGVRTVVVVATMIGVLFGATEIAIISRAGDDHGSGMTSALFAVWGLGSIVGGLVMTRYPWDASPARRGTVYLLVLAPTTFLLAPLPTFVPLAVGLVVAGFAIAPLLATVYAMTPSVTPAGQLTEAFGLQLSGTMAGIAAGAALGGAAITFQGAWLALLMAAVAALLGAAALHRRRASVAVTVAG